MIKVLCIDNSETIRRVVQDCVQDLGFEFFESENGKKGIEFAESIDDLDMIIFDWNMPVLNGKDFLIKVRDNAKLKNVVTFVLINVTEEFWLKRWSKTVTL